MAFSAARITRLGMSGFTRQKNGSFAGKGVTVAAVTKKHTGLLRDVGRVGKF